MGKKVQPRSALHHEHSEPQRQRVKIGLILECAPSGPDQQVCEYLVKRLQPDTEVDSRTMVNKKILIAECGEKAAQLLDDNCQRVIIVWDLYPPWRPKGEKPCRREDRKAICDSLKQAGVDCQKVHLVCICQELEAWLLADNRAIVAAIEKLIRRTPRITGIKKNPESVEDPKSRLDNIFRQYTHRPYQAHTHALKIVKELPDFKKIKRCQSFKQFVKATDTEL